MLHSDIQRDYSGQILDLLRANSQSLSDLAAEWTSHYKVESEGNRLVWLEHGMRLGVLQMVPVETLRQLLPTGARDVDTLSILFRARRLDYLEASEEQFDETINAVLESQWISMLRERVESVLDALTRAVAASRYGICFHNRQPVPFSAILSRRERGPSSIEVAPFTTGRYENHARCLEFAAAADEEIKLPAQQWVSDLGPWDRIVETGRSLWNDRFAFSCLATLGAGIRSTTEKCSDCPDLLDHSRSLTRRVRYARLRTAASNWWKAQFRKASSRFEKELVLLVAFTWGNINVLLANYEELEILVGQLTVEQWSRIVKYARRTVANVGLRSLSAKADFDVERLPKILSPRIAALFGQRIQAADRICRKYLRSFDQADPIVLEFVFEEALDMKRFGKPSWNPDLEQVKKCYSNGLAFEPYNFTRQYFRREDPSSVPIEIAKHIASNPLSFPEFLLTYAEERCRQDVAATEVLPVAHIAEKDGWFTVS